MGGAGGRATIRDVAALSGVSKTTVSNVLSGEGRVGAGTRARVQEAMNALGYRPNGLARGLVRRRANTVGVLVGDMANPYYAELVKALERSISALDCTTMICGTEGRLALEAERVERLIERTVSGVVLLQFSGEPAVLEALRSAGVPAVVISCWVPDADCVAVDDRAGMGLAVEHLHGLGHRRIAFAGSPLVEAPTLAARFEGYATAARLHGLEPVLMSAADAVRHVTAGVTAIVGANDLLAVELVDVLETSGLRVPADVSVVGFDGSALGAHPRIGLTSVAAPTEVLTGRAAWDPAVAVAGRPGVVGTARDARRRPGDVLGSCALPWTARRSRPRARLTA